MSQSICEYHGDIFQSLGRESDTCNGIVNLPNGEIRMQVLDSEIPGRRFNWKFERTYRSGRLLMETLTFKDLD